MGVGQSGASGGWCSKYLTSLLANYAFSCGAKGVKGAAGNNAGTNGGNTTFGSGPVILTANGGQGGQGGADILANNLIPGATPGTASGGDINSSGEAGFLGVIDVAATVPDASGNGGSTPYGAGGRGVTGNAGQNATGIGAGGSGGAADGGSGLAGGDGSAGAILIWEYS